MLDLDIGKYLNVKTLNDLRGIGPELEIGDLEALIWFAHDAKEWKLGIICVSEFMRKFKPKAEEGLLNWCGRKTMAAYQEADLAEAATEEQQKDKHYENARDNLFQVLRIIDYKKSEKLATARTEFWKAYRDWIQSDFDACKEEELIREVKEEISLWMNSYTSMDAQIVLGRILEAGKLHASAKDYMQRDWQSMAENLNVAYPIMFKNYIPQTIIS